MGKSAWPTQSEVETVLTSAGLTVGTLQTADATTAAQVAFEARVRRKMLAPAGTVTRKYCVPTGSLNLLDLEADLATVTSVVYRPRGSSGTTLVQDTDYFLEPANAGVDTLPLAGPYLAIRFADEVGYAWTEPVPGELRRAIEVTGRWGYGTSIPEDAWWAVLVYAANLVAPAAEIRISGGLIRTESAGASSLWGDGAASQLGWARREWGDDWDAAVRRYRRMSF